jgi:hypothetical protein
MNHNISVIAGPGKAGRPLRSPPSGKFAGESTLHPLGAAGSGVPALPFMTEKL